MTQNYQKAPSQVIVYGQANPNEVQCLKDVTNNTVQCYKVSVSAPSEQKQDTRAKQIDDWLYQKTKGKSPMVGLGSKYVQEADEHGIDWRLLPAISFAESTGGLHACKNNAWGWASCKIGFGSYEEGIAVITQKLSELPIYAGKGTFGKLYAYNGSVRFDYIAEVMGYMQEIG